MLDFTHIPSKANTQTFYAAGTSGSNTTWQTWIKPKNAKMVQIMCVGAGGGGASGFTSNALLGSNIYGGGGGASGGITKVIIPSSLIPDILYIQVGIGGRGGIGTLTGNGSGNAGGKGTDSIISIAPTSSVNSILCIAPGGNGGNISTTANTGYGAGGTSTTYTSANAPLIKLGLYTFEPTIAGKAAAGNGFQTPTEGSEVSIYPLNSSVVTEGAGGGGAKFVNLSLLEPQCTYAPGRIKPTSVFLLSEQPISPVASGQPSSDGYGILSPIFCGTGGTGGNHGGGTANGCKGGNGFYGGGGGGGGSAFSSSYRAGNGGNGGDGIIFITTSI